MDCNSGHPEDGGHDAEQLECSCPPDGDQVPALDARGDTTGSTSTTTIELNGPEEWIGIGKPDEIHHE